MKNRILQIYSLIGCFVSSFMIMVFSCLCFLSIKNITLPSIAYSKELVKFESKKNYLEDLTRQIKDHYGYPKELQEHLVAKMNHYEIMKPESLQNQLTAEKEEFLKHKKHENISDIFTFLTWMIGSLVFLFAHLIVYRKAKNAY